MLQIESTQIGVETTQVYSTQIEIATTQAEFCKFLRSNANQNDSNRIDASRGSSVLR